MAKASSERALDTYREQAFGLLTAPQARKVFDLSREKDSVHDLYGRTRFGQSCLLARRLVEQHVPFIQVNWSDHVEAEEDSGDGGWDHHYRNFQIMQDRHAPGSIKRSRPFWQIFGIVAYSARRWCWQLANSAARPRSTTKPAAITGNIVTAP